jgi:uncharacterized membrane protein HdeD (DUF308 family)
MTLPNGYGKNSDSEKIEPSRSGKTAQIIGIILLVIGVLILLTSLGAASAAALFFSIFLIVIGVIIIIRAIRKKERQTIKVKSQSKAKHGLVLFLYFLGALASCYGLYSEYGLGGESLIESMTLGIPLLITAAGLDESFGTTYWIRDFFSNRQKRT